MTTALRRTLATCLLSAVALGGAVVPSASASTDLTCDSPDAITAAVSDAQAALLTAQTAFHAANAPLGHLVSAARHAARVEIATSQTQMRDLQRQLRTASPADRAALRAQLRAERHDVAHARNLLETKRVALAQVKADRTAALAARAEARTTLDELLTLQESCTTTPAS